MGRYASLAHGAQADPAQYLITDHHDPEGCRDSVRLRISSATGRAVVHTQCIHSASTFRVLDAFQHLRTSGLGPQCRAQPRCGASSPHLPDM